MTLKERAESKANNYVRYALGDTPAPDEAFSAKEDYMAGYMDGIETNGKVLEYTRHQLRFILQEAGEKGEIHAHALVKFLLERLK